MTEEIVEGDLNLPCVLVRLGGHLCGGHLGLLGARSECRASIIATGTEQNESP